MKGDTFALDYICLDVIRIWLKYEKKDYIFPKIKRSGTGEGVPPIIIHYSSFIIHYLVAIKQLNFDLAARAA